MFKIIRYLAVLFTIGALLIGGFLIVNNQDEQKDVEMENDQSASKAANNNKENPQNLEVNDGWKVFTSEDFGIVFRYPVDYNVQETTEVVSCADIKKYEQTVTSCKQGDKVSAPVLRIIANSDQDNVMSVRVPLTSGLGGTCDTLHVDTYSVTMNEQQLEHQVCVLNNKIISHAGGTSSFKLPEKAKYSEAYVQLHLEDKDTINTYLQIMNSIDAR